MPGKESSGSVLELIGRTPLVKISRIVKAGSADVFAKLEYFNPAGSVKERIALAMVERAEEEGRLGAGGTVIEPTSGNTGIGLALVCAVRGYRCVLAMPDTMSSERISILKHFGAEVILTPGAEGMKGAVGRARELAAAEPSWCMPGQFTNPANPAAHETTTGPEIYSQMGGSIDAFVAGVGTGGTVTGAGRYLKRKNPQVRIIAVEPAGSPVLSGGEPGAHRIQGIGPGFVPGVLDLSLLDRVVAVSDGDAFRLARLLAEKEGIFCGVSSGAAMRGAVIAAEELGPGKTVAVVFPDGGDRYLSLGEFREPGICR